MFTAGYILKYRDGNYVKRSKGDFYYRTGRLSEATLFPSFSEAEKFGRAVDFKGMEQRVYPYHVEIGLGVVIPPLWEKCDRKCVTSTESISPEAKHYLNCDLMIKKLATLDRHRLIPKETDDGSGSEAH